MLSSCCSIETPCPGLPMVVYLWSPKADARGYAYPTGNSRLSSFVLCPLSFVLSPLSSRVGSALPTLRLMNVNLWG